MNALGPVLIILGSALGAAVQTATSTAMGLRIPAFFAALVMVAVGLRMIMRFPETEAEPPSGTLLPSSAVTEQATAGRPNLTVPVLLMVLSLWLGFANLVPQSGGSTPPALTTLATIAAFALFSIGWLLLPMPKPK